jgi:hypothetical protein
MRSVAIVNTGDSPSERTTYPVTTTAGPSDCPICVRTAKPAAATAKPQAMTRVGRIRRATTGASIDPMMNARPEGTVQSPAWRGLIPSTSCRYCAMKRNVPNATKKPRTLTASDAVNARDLNSDRSISGAGSVACLRTNTMPMAAPRAIAVRGSHPCPPSASLLIP